MRALLVVGLVGLVGLVPACGGASSGEPASGSSSGASGSSSGGPSSPSALTCDASRADDLEVAGADRDGFPPYAVAACTLAYISGAGELRARDLTTGIETMLAAASEHPRRPAVAEGVLAWEADEEGHSVVRVRRVGDASASTVTGPFVSAGEPRASGSTVVFTAWNGPNAADDTDIWLLDTSSGLQRIAFGGPGQQRFADVSLRYVVASDFSEDSDGRFDGNETDVADLVFLDLASGDVSTRRFPGKQSFPILGDGDTVAYLDWAAIHPEPKLQAYAVKSGQLTAAAAADRTIATVAYVSTTYARPALTGSTLEWVANPEGPTQLYRAPVDGSVAPVVVGGLGGLRLYAPASTREFSVLAAAPQAEGTAAPRLRALPR